MTGFRKQYRCFGPGVFHNHRYGGELGPDVAMVCGQCDAKIHWDKNKSKYWTERFIIKEWVYD